MARAIWSGSISFGLVNVPVGLYSATQDHQVHFHQFEKDTSSRVRNQRVNEDTGDEVAYKNVVKGAEVAGGGYVMLTQEELESVEPGRSGTIDVSDFVAAAEIDPVHYQKSYYLAPAGDSAKVQREEDQQSEAGAVARAPEGVLTAARLVTRASGGSR